ncbi:MAG: alkaline phosphatase family protein [Ferruginibacter sp.]|nr:alkaline phosphatase family protein [Ferruginibacter sp.]
MKLSKATLFTLFTLFTFIAAAQKVENIIIITTDGLRWQELFGGMDSAIANNAKYNQGDSSLLFEKYWAATAQERRKKLLPFLWSTIQQNGQLHGNRTIGNKVDVANPYWFSYPGYSEIFTGYVDTLVNSNEYKANPNTTLLEFLNKQNSFKNKVAAFGAWNAFNRILNEERSGITVINAFEKSPLKNNNAILLNKVLEDSYKPFGEAECLDVFTHYAAMDYLKIKKPKALYISYGETDEWAHSGQYRDYLNAANQVDKWIESIWNYIQSTPQYKNKTALFITTDHGRGDSIKKEWTSHNNKIVGANEIWFAVMAPGIQTKGEVKTNTQLYQKQFAQTMANLLGLTFTCEHPVGEKINLNE